MNHSIEVEVYVLNNQNDDVFDEVPLEVTFDIYGNDSEITGYFVDGKPVKVKKFLDLNPSLEKLINLKLDKYVMNHEPSYMDCE